MIEVRQTLRFQKWFKALPDLRAKARIDMRIARLAAGNAGDAKYFAGIGELRLDYGPGYRLYFMRRGEEIGDLAVRRGQKQPGKGHRTGAEPCP